MKRRMLISALLVLGLSCAMAIHAVRAAVLYDLNDDGIVNMEDIARVARAFRSYLGELRFDEMLDFDVNGIVNIRDIALIAGQFGQTAHEHTPKPPGATFVVPELPIGPLIGIVGCFTALGIFSLVKQSKHSQHFSKH